MSKLTKVLRMEVKIIVGGEERSFGPVSASCYDKTLSNVCDEYRSQLRGMIKGPNEDNSSRKFHRGYMCGAVGYNQLMNWFPMPRLWRKMLAVGFELVEYTVNSGDVGICDSQAFFHKDDVIRSEVIDFETMRNDYKSDRRKRFSMT